MKRAPRCTPGPPRRGLRITRYRPDPRRDVAEEIELHLEMKTRELIDAGVDPAEARRLAQDAFGDLDDIAGECLALCEDQARRRRLRVVLRSLGIDLRMGLRQLTRRPLGSLLVILTWTLCIGGNAAIFSLVHGILFQPLPYPQPDRIVSIHGSLPAAGSPRISSSLGDLARLRAGVPALESVALYSQVSEGVGDEDGGVRNVFSMHVTPSLFEVLRVPPALGRSFVPADAEPQTEGPLIISHALWQGMLGGAPDVVGRRLAVEGGRRTIVGVMPEGFLFDDWEAHLWLPIVAPPGATVEELAEIGGYDMIGRIAPEASLSAVRAQVQALDSQLLREAAPDVRRLATEGGFHTVVEELRSDQVNRVRPALYLLWGGVLFLLALGISNVATLSIARNCQRAAELATRYALGAGRSRVACQLVIESLALALAGGVAGLLLGAWSLGWLDAFQAYEIPRVGDVQVGARVIGFVLALTVAVGSVAGLVPVLAVRSRDLYGALRRGGASAPAGSLTGRGSGALARGVRLRGVLVAGQVAVAFVLLVSAVLMATSLASVLDVDPGFDTDRVVAGATVVPWSRYSTPPARNQFILTMLEELAATPGVLQAAVASQLPLSGIDDVAMLVPEQASESASGEMLVPFVTTVSSGYFEVMGIPIVEGRGFRQTDSGVVDPVVVVDERLARRYWPRGPAVGRRVRLWSESRDDEPREEARWLTVIGVVGSVVQNDLTDPEANGAFYLPYRDTGLTFMRLVARTEVPPESVAPALRERLVELDPELRFFWVQSLQASLEERLIFRRLPTYLLLAFATMALLLSALGVYGVLGQLVASRRREVGLRRALGGRSSAIVSLFLRHALVLVSAGLGIGMVAAAALTRLLRSQLFGVHPNDPIVFTTVALLIAGVALGACAAPVRSALRVNPITALRGD